MTIHATRIEPPGRPGQGEPVFGESGSLEVRGRVFHVAGRILPQGPEGTGVMSLDEPSCQAGLSGEPRNLPVNRQTCVRFGERGQNEGQILTAIPVGPER